MMTDWTLLSEASTLAFRLHAEQHRKSTTIPYIAHLMAVSALVLEHGGDQEQAVAALLHDAIEDCGPEHEGEIAARFGPRVAAIVRACTDADTFPKPPWRARKEAYIAHLAKVEDDALLVSACDKLHNARAIVADLRALGPDMMERFTGGLEGTMWYYGALLEAFAARLGAGHRLVADLAQEVQQMQALVR
ncbi:HD domain-containing protein [Sabulicella glaciei]|uniref:HD domain-containing protein n=1 Tax=Sabulicella glaciei TaxID=2984948 RepID=A0ABT3P0U0_9PROT|nr:HD domain-containing protein [Roseococcus sp. MDT2-1-1]MCW8088030.1 HD domain-containing protein [Roseococcus sp. MDT2-1-1]